MRGENKHHTPVLQPVLAKPTACYNRTKPTQTFLQATQHRANPLSTEPRHARHREPGHSTMPQIWTSGLTLQHKA